MTPLQRFRATLAAVAGPPPLPRPIPGQLVLPWRDPRPTPAPVIACGIPARPAGPAMRSWIAVRLRDAGATRIPGTADYLADQQLADLEAADELRRYVERQRDDGQWWRPR